MSSGGNRGGGGRGGGRGDGGRGRGGPPGGGGGRGRDDLPRQMHNMNLNDRGRGGQGGGGGRGGYDGGRGGGYDGGRGGGRGGGFDRGGRGGGFDRGSRGGGGRGGGRSVTRVTFEQRNPKCQNEVRPEYPPLGRAVWKPFDPDQEQPIDLPVRKPENRAIATGNQQIDIVLNHFPVNIKFPKMIYAYRVDIERKRVKKDAGGSGSKPDPKKGKLPPRGGGDNGGAGGPVRMLPTDLRKRILKSVIPDMQKRFGQEFGIITDYSASIYTIKQLQDKGESLEFEVNGSQIVGEDDTFLIKITGPTENINTANLQFDINNMRGKVVSGELVNLERVYSTLIRCVKMNAYTPMKRSYLIDFTQPAHPLGGGVCSYQGYDIMLPLANGWKKFINIEMANLAAYLNGPVTNVLADLFSGERYPPNPNDVSTWKPAHFAKANEYLKTCKIIYSPSQSRKFSKVVMQVVRQSVSDVKFSHEGKQISVYEYFRRTYNTDLKYPKGPCLELKGNNSPKVPAEICTMKDGQSYNRKLDENQVTAIAEKARLEPPLLQPAIQNAVRDLGLNGNSMLTSYGMSMANGGQMHQIKTKILTPPEICYGGKRGSNDGTKATIIPDRGEWDIWQSEFEFFRNCSVKKWGILNLTAGAYRAVSENDAYGFAAQMSRKGGMRGINLVAEPEFYQEASLNENNRDENFQKLVRIFEEFRKHVGEKDLQESFILVILPKKGSLLYNHVKQAAELKAGVLTQCIVGANMTNPKRLDSICGNLWLKINSKLTKVNHVILPPPNFKECFKIFDYPTMIIGADVTHPPPGSSRIQMVKGKEMEVGPPSFAAITASIDRTGMPYMMHIQAQEKANKGAAEVIYGLDVIVKKFLMEFHKRTRQVKPCRIVYYRDGVGEGQFQEVLRTEMKAMRAACTALHPDYKPAITFVTVQKRHKTRFFCKSGNSYDNAPPGTVIDVDIVHPTETDFYLLSHKGLLGTSRPTRYHVLWDDWDFSMEELQIMSYFLCYMFVRCNRSVKIPAPTYYAHWAAKRAEVLAKGVCESMYGNIQAINDHLNGGTRELITEKFPMHFV